MRKQISTSRQLMEKLSFEQGEDHRNQQIQNMYAAALALAHSNNNIKKDVLDTYDKTTQQNATKILKRSKQFTQDEISYPSILTNLSKLAQYQPSILPAFQVKSSGSSSQQIQPIYQSVDQVVNIGAGEPVVLEFYVVGKIIWPNQQQNKGQNDQNEQQEPVLSVKKIKYFKRANQPTVQTVFSSNQYRIYKITVNSLIKTYQLQYQYKEQTKTITTLQFNQLQSKISLQNGIIIDLTTNIQKAQKKQKMQKFDYFQQVLILSLCTECQCQQLKQNVEIEETIEICGRDQYIVSENLVNTICVADDLQFCHELVNKIIQIRENLLLKPGNTLYNILMRIIYTNKSHIDSKIHSITPKNSSPQQCGQSQKYINLLITNQQIQNNQKYNNNYIKIQSMLKYLQQTCKQMKLQHYSKIQNLFVNFCDDILKSIVFLGLEIGKKQKYGEQEIIKECLEKLMGLAKKDFQYLLSYFFDSEKKNSDSIQCFRSAIQAKGKKYSSSKFAVVLVTDQNCWKTTKADDQIIVVQADENQANLKKKIKSYLITKKNYGILYLDCTSPNLSPNVSYLIYVYKKCFTQLQKQRKQFARNKIRIIINNNNNLYVPFLQDFDIFCLDDIGIQEKQRIIQEVVTPQIYKECFGKFAFKIHQMEHNEEVNNMLIELENQIINNKSFDLCCKQLLLHTSCNTSDATEQQINQCLNIKYHYKSIATPITKLVLLRKIHEPIKYLIKNFAHDNLLLNYVQSVKQKLLGSVVLDINIDIEKSYIKQKEKVVIGRLIMIMGRKKVQILKKGYKQIQRNFQNQGQGWQGQQGQVKAENVMIQVKQIQQKVELTLNFPTFLPFSEIQTKILLTSEKIQQIKTLTKSDPNEFSKKFKYFEAEHNKKLQQTFGQFNKTNIFDIYYELTREKNSLLSKMLMVDICLCLADKIKISKKNIFHFVSQLEKIFQQQENILKIIVQILGNLEIFGPALRIFSCFTQNKIQKLIDCGQKFNSKQIGIDLLNHSHDHLRMQYSTISKLSTSQENQNTSLNKKLIKFAQIHHIVYFQVANLLSAGLFQQSNLIYKQMTITEDFMNIWILINKQNPQIEFEQELKKLQQNKHYFQKIGIIMQFLSKFMQDESPLSKKVQQYLANKLFPSWFNQCTEEAHINVVFDKFYALCEKSSQFAHNSTGSVLIALSCLNLDYTNKAINSTIEKLKNTNQQQKNNETLKKKLLIKMGTICQEKIFNDNLSVLISNMMFINLRRFNTLIQNPTIGFTYQDLQNNFQYFTKLIQSILSSLSSILKLFAFAYIRLYLLYYIQIAKPEDAVCIQIDKILSQQNKLMANFRLYCVKLLRRKFTSKQICEKYIKIGTFKWCNFLKQQMKQHQARAIQVPKLPQNFIKNDAQQKIRLFIESQGKDVHFLDQIIALGCGSIQGRYIVFNFFLKYIYTMAYNKAYDQVIINHVKSKQTQYSSKIGKQQYNLILRYTTSKFDQIYFVKSHQQFSQCQFLILNNINWLLASRRSKSPIHSLFFSAQTSQFHDKISQQLHNSFIPCGVDNLFINQAKAILAATRSCNIGVYICDAQCDYMYALEDCGWPGSPSNCQICGQPIASAGGHKLQRVDKGGRRIMSHQFKDDARLYVWRSNLVNYQELWEAQRYYITAEINRMKMKSAIRLKPVVNGKRQIEMQSLLGYQFNSANDKFSLERVSSIGSKVMMQCFQSNLYALVSLDIIKAQQYVKLFGINNKSEILHKLNQKINKNIAGMKQILDLNTKFYTWVLGIQAEHYKFLINFQLQFTNYVQNVEKQSQDLSTKLKTKQQGFKDALFKALYTDMMKSINAGLVTKQLKQIEAKKQMSARNQFTRQVYQQSIDKLIAANLFENKQKFVQKWHETQGKMQFPFDVVLTESKLDSQTYVYSRVLKLPSESLTFQQISTKYQTIISQRYPFLNYLLSNMIQLNILSSFATVVSNCNIFFNKINYQLTRGFTKNFQLSKFNQTMCRGQLNTQEFIKAWKQISGYLGSIQVGCKVYGTMNDQFGVNSQVYGFLLDDTLKQNANGKVIVGIFNNFAVLHNQILTVLNTNKNLIPKYQKLNFMVQNQKISPQKISPEHSITLSQKQIMSKILQSSVPSIIYGQNLVYHNFDYCQAYFLNKLKGKCQLDPNIQKYVSIKYVGETFSTGTAGTNVNAIGVVSQATYQQIGEEERDKIFKEFKVMGEIQVYVLFGQIQQLINKMSENPQNIKNNAQTKIIDYLSQFPTLPLQNLLATPIISNRPVSQLIPVFTLMQQYIRPYLLPTIPQKYITPLQQTSLTKIKEYLKTLPHNQQQSFDSPTISQFYTAVQNFIYRNLLSQFYDKDKGIFQFIVEKEDYWGYQYDIYAKNMGIYNVETVMSLKAGNAVDFMRVVKEQRDSRQSK